MPNSFRSLRVAAIGPLLLCAAAAALAQDSNTVGPEQLRDFDLPGTRSRPAPPPAPAATTTTVPPAATTTAPVSSPSRAAPPPRPAPRPAAPTLRAPGSAAAPIVTAAPPSPLPQPEPDPTSFSAPAPSSPLVVAPEAPAAAGPSYAWLWALLAAATLALLVFVGLRTRKTASASGAEAEGALFREPAPAPEPEPAPAPDLAAIPEPETGPRAWLETDLIPDRAAATDTEATVHFELILRNAGTAPAGNIRIDSRMFNASAEAEMSAFLDGPIHEQSGSPHISIAPGGELRIASRIAMPREDVREVVVEGRSLFIPVVAINVAYDWAQRGAGRTSKSWLVGREAASPAAKMGAFRLDLGPRIYRSLGRREARLARMV
jgi:hypothetical protein